MGRNAIFVLLGTAMLMLRPATVSAAGCESYRIYLGMALTDVIHAENYWNEDQPELAKAEVESAQHNLDMSESMASPQACLSKRQVMDAVAIEVRIKSFENSGVYGPFEDANDIRIDKYWVAFAKRRLRLVDARVNRTAYDSIQANVRDLELRLHRDEKNLARATLDKKRSDAEAARITKQDEADAARRAKDDAKAGVPVVCTTPDQEAIVINPYSPEVPAIAQQQGITGVVEVQVQLNSDGKIVGTPVVLSGPSMLRSAAVSATKQSQFQTTIRHCVPEAAIYINVVRFTRS